MLQLSQSAPAAPAVASRENEAELVAALRAGDEGVFAALVQRYHASMVRVARGFVGGDQARAEEVAQDAWLGVLRGLGAFAGRSSLRTWLFRIVVNRARSVARRDRRTVAFSHVFGDALDDDEVLVEPERFQHPLAAGHWTEPLRSWEPSPEEQALGGEARAEVERALEWLPPLQRSVVTLRDIEGWEAEEVCNTLAISSVHQRVLLHRARTKLRRALERYFDRDTK